MYINIPFAQCYIGFQIFPNVQSPFYLDRILTHIELMHGIEKHQSFGVFFCIWNLNLWLFLTCSSLK